MLFRTVVGPSGSTEAPLLILHGLFGSHRNWQTASRSISERTGRQVISLDLRNHGRSVQFDADGRPIGMEMNWPVMVEDVRAAIRSIARPVVLMGHSLGGQAVMKTLFSEATNTDLIKDAILVDISPRSYDFAKSDQLKYLRAMRKIQEVGMKRIDALNAFREIESNEAIVQFLFTNWGKHGDGMGEGFLIPLKGLEEGMIALGKTFSSEIKPIRVSHPALFIKGGRSEYIKPHDTLINEYFPNHDLKSIVDSGHWPHYERPMEFLQIVTDRLVHGGRGKRG